MSLENLDAIIAKLRKVSSGDFVLADDHNDLVDAVKEIRSILEQLQEQITAPAEPENPSGTKPFDTLFALFESLDGTEPTYISELLECMLDPFDSHARFHMYDDFKDCFAYRYCKAFKYKPSVAYMDVETLQKFYNKLLELGYPEDYFYWYITGFASIFWHQVLSGSFDMVHSFSILTAIKFTNIGPTEGPIIVLTGEWDGLRIKDNALYYFERGNPDLYVKIMKPEVDKWYIIWFAQHYPEVKRFVRIYDTNLNLIATYERTFRRVHNGVLLSAGYYPLGFTAEIDWMIMFNYEEP